jgi:hypothetical protein
MKNPLNLKPGEEQYETIVIKISNKRYVQYDYMGFDGQLFSCVKKTLDECRAARDKKFKVEGSKNEDEQ